MTTSEIMINTKNMTLLYVEDNEDARDALVDILDEFFNNVIIAINGLDGLEKFKSNQIDIVITDINMPKMNGIEMLEVIKKIDNSIKILVFSAHNESSYFSQTQKIGVDGYLLKPFEFRQFTSSLERIFEK